MGIRVLSASDDSALRHSRELLLQAHGCEVKTSFSKSHAQELIQAHAFDVLVCGNSLSEEVCQALAKDFRARNPRGKIIEILAADWKAPMNQPDAVVVGPEELIAVIRRYAGLESVPTKTQLLEE